MEEIMKKSEKSKAWRRAKSLVLHSARGPMVSTVANCEPEIELLLDPRNFPVGGPWTPVIHGDTLHLIHPYYTFCEGEA